MRRSLVSVAVASAYGSSLPSDFFYGRSGDIVIHSTAKPDAQVVLTDGSKEDITQMPIEAVANYAARSLGVLPNNPLLEEKQHTSFFSHARANLMINVEAVSAGELSVVDTEVPGSSKATLELSNCPPSSTISLLSCISTGHPASTTGIVGATWKEGGRRTFAFSTPDTYSLKANLADTLAQSFGGQSLTISFSGDNQQGAAFCVHPQLADKNPGWKHNYCVRPGNLELGLPAQAELAKTFARGGPDSLLTALSQHGVSAVFENNGVTFAGVEGPGEQGTLTLSLEKDADAAVLAELQGAFSISRRLSQDPVLRSLVADDVPDAFTLTISSAARMTKAYGAGSARRRDFAVLLDACLAVYLQAFRALYPGRLSSQVLSLGGGLQTEKVSALVQALSASADDLPSVYVPPDQVLAVCAKLAQGLGKAFSVSCPHASPQSLKAVVSGRILLAAGDVLAPTDSQKSQYQIMVWVSIFAALIVLFAFYSMATMSFKKDTMLYSTFNPKWEDRKQK